MLTAQGRQDSNTDWTPESTYILLKQTLLKI